MTKPFDALIVGAGPAGVSCGIWLQQLGFKAALIDRNAQCGGLQLLNPWTNTWIASSAGVTGADVAQALHANAVRHGCTLYLGETAKTACREDAVWAVTLGSGALLRATCLVLAGGVSPKTGGLRARAALLIGPGPQVASTNFDGSRVAILGGGDSAFENYHFVTERGAREVHVYARTLRARAQLLDGVPPEAVRLGDFAFDDANSTVNGVPYDRVLVLFGYEANKSSLLGLEPALHANGFVQTDGDCLTSLPRVWAIGELAQRAHPCCATAMADGVVAAKAIQRDLEDARSTRYRNMALRSAGLLKKTVGAQ